MDNVPDMFDRVLDDTRYIFYNEDGKQVITYGDYLADESLRSQVNDNSRERLFLGRTILTYAPRFLAQNEEKAEAFYALKEDQIRNPLKYFAPSGPAATEFLNARKKIKFMRAPNRMGKTTTGIIDWLLDLVPCDKNWPIFTEHGVEWRPFRPPAGGYKIGIATYKWANHKRTIYPELRKWLPQDELGPYALSWQKKGARNISWERNPELPLTSGSHVYFFVYEMDQDQYEGQALDGWLWDEQGEEAKWIGANERTRTRKGRHVFSLTPHKVKGRADTGFGSWIHKIVKKETKMGYLPDQIAEYGASLPEVPDWVYPEEEKEAAYRQHILEPMERNDKEALQEGRSRFYGEWHETAGMVYPMWDRRIHVIEPFDIPSTWTRYRSIDHGKQNPCACLWCAVSPQGHIILYREYYSPGLISDHCRKIIDISGNKRIPMGQYRNPSLGMTLDKYREEYANEVYAKTAFDSRSFSRPDDSSGMTLSELYRLGGLKLHKASGKNRMDTVPLVEEWLKVDWEKPNDYNKSEDGDVIMGRPRVYVFSTLRHFVLEMENYIMEEVSVKRGDKVNESERPRAKDDHLMDALRYLIQLPPVWRGGSLEQKEGRTSYMRDLEERKKNPPRDGITGY